MLRLGSIRPVVLAVSALAASGCALRQVRSYTEHGFDPSLYHSYRWAPDEERPTGDPRLDNNPFFRRSVQAGVDDELAKRGFEKATAGRADLVLQYHALVTQRVEMAGADLVYRACTDCKPYLYDAGSLVIDVVDAETRALLWRGWAEGDIGGIIENQSSMEELVGQTVSRIMERLPRGR